MIPTNPEPTDQDAQPSSETGDFIGRLAHIIGQAARFEGDTSGLGSGERAALARLDPDGEPRPHQIAALSRALLYAGLDPGSWRPDTWRRWALIAHGIALAGHDDRHGLGEQLHQGEVSESRVTKLLTARGDAFRQLVPRLLRLLAAKETAPNWYQLGMLILYEGRQEIKAESIRLRIASDYYRAERRTAEEQAA
jgi:CRISPR system Cascade subunit CasB